MTTKWGVVVAHEEGHYLRSVDTMLTHVAAWGNSVVRPFPRRTLPAAFVVGDVMGRVAPPRQAGQPSVDFYQRITNADIAGIGGKKKRSPSSHKNILEWLGVAGRPGIGPSRI